MTDDEHAAAAVVAFGPAAGGEQVGGVAASRVSAGTVFQGIAAEISVDRHGDTTHFLYADGHVDAVESRQIDEWATQPFNFAKPPS
jgi:prepilin-type processing-associated H-X9-DG protein